MGNGHVPLRSSFFILHSRFSRFFFSPCDNFPASSGSPVSVFFLLHSFPFGFRLVLSLVRLPLPPPFIFFSSLLPFVFFLYFELTGRALRYRYRDPPRHFSLYRRPSADGLEGPTMPARESSVMFAVFSRVGVTCSDGRPTFHVCFIFFYSDTLFLIFSRRLRHVSVNVITDDV